MAATNVPWPRPSPGELFGSDVMVTSARMREPKSDRPFSMPESTIAIVGALAEAGASQRELRPATWGQRCELNAESMTGASLVIARMSRR